MSGDIYIPGSTLPIYFHSDGGTGSKRAGMPLHYEVMLKGFVLIEENDRYLLIQEAGTRWKGRWFLPGGKAKRGEAPETAAVRETREEAGLQVQIEGVIFVKYYTGYFSQKLHLFYKGRCTGGKLKTRADKQSLQARWFTFEEIKKLPVRAKLVRIIESYRRDMVSMSLDKFRIVEL